MGMPELRPEVRLAVTWKITSELLRRHHQEAKLCIYETHSGRGLYDCVSLFAGQYPMGTHLCDFNQSRSHFHVFSALRCPRFSLDELRWPDGNDYVIAYLQSEDPKEVVDQVEGVLGLPLVRKAVPPTSAPVLTVRLIAEIAVRTLMKRVGFEIRSGLHQYKRYERVWPPQRTQADPFYRFADPHGRRRTDEFGSRFWMLRRRTNSVPNPFNMVFDLSGFGYSFTYTTSVIGMWNQNQREKRIGPLTERILDIWSAMMLTGIPLTDICIHSLSDAHLACLLICLLQSPGDGESIDSEKRAIARHLAILDREILELAVSSYQSQSTR